MLRREVTIEGKPHWQLIPQIEHARLSGELAKAYQPLAVSPLHDSLLKAVYHHDDGWREWDAAPANHPNWLDEQGRPLTFSEIDRQASLTIWQRSVRRTVTHDVTAAYFVAEHFKQLLERSDEPTQDGATQHWLEEMADIQRLTISDIGKSTLDRFSDVVPAFDALSLWMCEAILAEEPSFQLASGCGEAVLFTRTGEWQFAAEPWPFAAPQLSGTLESKLVPVARYGNSNQLLAAAVDEQITWQIHQSKGTARISQAIKKGHG